MCPNWPQTIILLIPAFRVAKVTGWMCVYCVTCQHLNVDTWNLIYLALLVLQHWEFFLCGPSDFMKFILSLSLFLSFSRLCSLSPSLSPHP
jgi:hypothetical protein